MEVWDICKPARSVAAWSSPLIDTYPLVRKGPRPEVGTSLTHLATGNEDTGCSGHKVRNSALVKNKTKSYLVVLYVSL